MKNEINDEKQKEALIRSLGVFELRGLARELGVPSPTTKKREELIALIADKIKDGSTLDTNNQRRGRPFKKLNALDDIVNTVLEDDYKAKDYDSVISFMQEDLPIVNDMSDEVCEFEGIIRESKSNFCFNDIKSDAKVFMDFNVEGYDVLKAGMYIKVDARKVNGNVYWTEKIKEVDGQPLSRYEYKEVEKGKEVISDNGISFGNMIAKEGRRNIFCYTEDLYENKVFENFYHNCKNSDSELIILSINTSYENQIMFRNLNVENLFNSSYGEVGTVAFFKVVDVINYAQHLINQGKKVVVFIADIVDVLRKLDDILSSKEELANGYNAQTLLIVQKLLALGRAYENGPSGTIIMGYNEIDKNDKFLTNDILKISKKLN